MPSLTRNITHKTPQANDILKEIRRRVKMWEQGVSRKKGKWAEAEERALAYLPEREIDVSRKAARDNGLPQYTTIQIPYSYAVVMAAHTYLTSVFMGRDPVYQYSGRHGESQQQVQAIEALVDYQVQQAQMQVYFYTWLYDMLKYGEGIQGLWWDEKIDIVTQIQDSPTQVDPLTGQVLATEKLQMSYPVRTYAGNRTYNVQPQKFIWDTRVTMREFQSGEFCGEKVRIAWNEIIRRKKKGYYMNTEHLKGRSDNTHYGDNEGSSVLERPEELWSAGEDSESVLGTHPSVVALIQLCIEIIPSEWRLSNSDYPEKWVFTCTDNYDVLLGAQPLGAAHCKYPYSVLPLEPEGYGLTTRGMPEILEPIQNTIDWLINTHFYNVRASLNNQFIVDPSKVVMKDLLDPLPGNLIRLKPEAYGSDPKLAITQLPVADITGTHIQNFPLMVGIGERVGGVNDQIMGMLSGGGRKTATEVRTSTSFGINRLKTVAEWASVTGVGPLSAMLVQNSQQYFDMDLKLKIAGDLALNAGAGFIQVNPQLISGFYDFVPVDGTMPIDRFAQVQLWQQMFQSILQVPQIGMQYDLAGIFTWVAQLAGLKNITQFKIQVLPDQLLAAQAGLGNAVPMNGAGPKGKGPYGSTAEGTKPPPLPAMAG